MSSLIPNSDKTILGDVFYSVADTFSRPIVMFQTAQEIVISTNVENNAYFPDSPNNDQVQTIIQSGVFPARIKYDPKEVLELFSDSSRGKGVDQTTLKKEDGWVRIKLDMTGSAYLAGAERCRFDGDIFEIMTSKRPHGLFTPQFNTFYLKKVN